MHLTNLLLETTRPEHMSALSVAIDGLEEKVRMEQRTQVLDPTPEPVPVEGTVCTKSKFFDGTRCGDYGFHFNGCPEKTPAVGD